MSTAKRADRKLYIEAMRSVAALGVVFIHTYTDGHWLFSRHDPDGLRFSLYMCISIFSICFVPMFFMISGALLLKKNESIAEVWKKRISRMFFILIVFSLINYGEQIMLGAEQEFSIRYFLFRLYKNYWNYSYWYIYSFIAWLVMLPVLQRAVKGLENAHFIYLIAIVTILTGIYPILRYLICRDQYNLSPYFNLWWVGENIVIYPTIGYYLENRADISRAKKWIPLLWLLSVAGLVSCCWLTRYKYYVIGGTMEYGGEYWECFALLYAITMFLTIKWMFYERRVPALVDTVLRVVGRNSFGIYLFHVMILDLLQNTGLLDLFRVQLGINDMLSIWIYCVIVLLISLVLTRIMRLLPLLRDWL